MLEVDENGQPMMFRFRAGCQYRDRGLRLYRWERSGQLPASPTSYFFFFKSWLGEAGTPIMVGHDCTMVNTIHGGLLSLFFFTDDLS